MIRIFFRTLVISFLRFIAIMAIVIFQQRFEVSPLPEWTFIVFLYVLHILATYLFARWVFARRLPEPKHVLFVAVLFVVLEAMFEGGLYLVYTSGDWHGLWANYSLWSLWIATLYFGTVMIAGWLARRKRIQANLPEGMEA